MNRLYGTGIVRSLILSIRQMMRGTITVQYPHERLVLPERARWSVAMTLDEEGSHKCTACRACEKACPDHIILLDITTGEDRSRYIDRWHYELGACMMCGLCVEACPFDAIHMSHDYELAVTDPALLNVDLLASTPAAEPRRKAAPTAPQPQPTPPDSAPRSTTDTPAPTMPAEGGDDA